ncbi:DNA-binding response regulator, OmpR family, contains REC and winged-helix (wHTH) domain [Paenibacillus jilunlii]|uniref:DNA-binding response regulator, OmpR family, contains REC and winged-helix (WHTH) domain n=1 Tax=Paenibacillus jilunlii TaxID=682956 RepID=A0A1G9FR84_9BACL|nr:DNA-binding response regulator, OmpR family, contains REC and winged-helix (wHTH) domain [Paenibacillus jilunlii]
MSIIASNILIVEDDHVIHDLLIDYLRKEGYETESAYTGEEAVRLLKQMPFQLLILDLMLPEMDGFEVLRRVRETQTIPVLILSAKGQEVDKIIGLGLGADDYLTKPFGLGELSARVKAMLRRYFYFNNHPNDQSPSVLNHGGLVIDLHTYEVSSRAGKKTLTAKEFDILKLFLSYPSRVFTKAQIFQAVWKEDPTFNENTVMVHIRRLRTKIEPDPSSPIYIQTVWGIGYKLGEAMS